MSPPLPCGIPVLADAGGTGGCTARVAAGGTGGRGGCAARVAAGGAGGGDGCAARVVAGGGGGCTARVVAGGAGGGVGFAARVIADAGDGVGFAARVVTEGAVGCGLLVADELAADPLLGLPLDEPPQPATASTIPAAANNAGSTTRTFLIRVLISQFLRLSMPLAAGPLRLAIRMDQARSLFRERRRSRPKPSIPPPRALLLLAQKQPPTELRSYE
jgi:hypothetical protein